MRAHRFVRFLGDAVDAVGRETADAAADLARQTEAGQLPTGPEPGEAVSDGPVREFPRRVGRRLDGASKGGVEFFARVLSGGREDATPTAALGVVLAIDLPAYATTTAVLADCRTWAAPTDRDRYDVDGLAGTAGAMLDRTPDAFVLALPVDGGAAVVPATAVVASAADGAVSAAFPHELYARSVGRFVEEFAEGFVGDGRLAPAVSASMGWDAVEPELRAFRRETGVQDVLYVAVSGSTAATTPTLGDFVGE